MPFLSWDAGGNKINFPCTNNTITQNNDLFSDAVKLHSFVTGKYLCIWVEIRLKMNSVITKHSFLFVLTVLLILTSYT